MRMYGKIMIKEINEGKNVCPWYYATKFHFYPSASDIGTKIKTINSKPNITLHQFESVCGLKQELIYADYTSTATTCFYC